MNKNGNSKLLIFGMIILTGLSILSMASKNFLNPDAITSKDSWRPHHRKISSVSNNRNFLNSRIAPSPSTTPFPTPIISPDSPLQPRVSSAQAGDLPLGNLFNFFNLNVINQPSVPEALCNDGSKPAYYIKKGFGSGAKRWVIWLEGGGACGSSDQNDPTWCGLRAPYSISSNNMPGSVVDFQGIISKSDYYNPDFYSYNQVFVHYCSSDFWGGLGVQKVINESTQTKFWFSGRKIIEALILDLKQKYYFNQATNVILTGSSAGGGGIVINGNEIKQSLSNADFVTLVDASNFFTFYDFESGLIPEDQLSYTPAPGSMKQAYDFLPMEGNRECLRKRFKKCGPTERCANMTYECMLPGHAAPYLNTPVFMSSDQLDNLVLDTYGLSLCDNMNPQDYNRWLNAFIAESNSKAQQVSGYFLPRTGSHGLAPTHHWSTPLNNVSGTIRLKDIFGAWYFNRSSSPKKYIQSAPAGMYPHQEAGCQ